MNKKQVMVLAIVLFFILIMFAVQSFSMRSEPAAAASKSDLIDKYIENLTDKAHFSGAVLVAKEGEILLKKGYNMADYKKQKPNSVNTIYRLASMTKQFTAVCILMLEERGLLNTEDYISKHLPDFPNGEKIRIHNLLNHTSGLEDYFTVAIANAKRYYPPEELVNLFKNKPLRFEPGEKYEYSNSNYVLLGYLIEKLSGMSYESFLTENILAPLNMADTSLDHNEALENKAVGYKYINGKMTYANGSYAAANYIDPSVAYSAGAMQSTVEDLYKWNQALYTEILVKQDTLKKAFTPYKGGYGYGWWVEKSNNVFIIKHTGWINGFSCGMYQNRNNNVTVIVLTNNEYGFPTYSDNIFSYIRNIL